MISNDQELQVTQDRIARLQAQVTHLRKVESNPANYRAASSGFVAEIDRMQLEVREYRLRWGRLPKLARQRPKTTVRAFDSHSPVSEAADGVNPACNRSDNRANMPQRHSHHGDLRFFAVRVKADRLHSKTESTFMEEVSSIPRRVLCHIWGCHGIGWGQSRRLACGDHHAQ
jgi:hypothetical protein